MISWKEFKQSFSGQWNRYYGTWWMVQWIWTWWFSLGIHIDFKSRTTTIDSKKVVYGPYIDFHLGIFIISIGRNPVYSTGEAGILGRGGVTLSEKR